MKDCDVVAERLALGESLGELAAHVASCAACARLVEVPGQLGATHHPIDPGLGFSARMTVGAQHRFVARRRRRIAVGLATSVAAGALGVLALTRAPGGGAPGEDRAAIQSPSVPTSDDPVEVDAADLAALVNLADTGRARKLSADWRRIERPLAPYRHLVHRVGLAAGDTP